jgi:hypothetical protein
MTKEDAEVILKEVKKLDLKTKWMCNKRAFDDDKDLTQAEWAHTREKATFYPS